MRLDRLSRRALLALLAILLVAETGLVYLGVQATRRQAPATLGQPAGEMATAPHGSGTDPADAPGGSATRHVAWAPPDTSARPTEGQWAAAGDLAAIARAFDVEEALAHVEALAAPAFAGRQPGTPGHAAAGEYITDRFREYGLLPLVGESFFQEFTVPYARVTAPPTLDVTGPSGEALGDLAFRRDYAYVWGGYAGGGGAAGRVFWLSDGLREDYRGLDVAGGVILCRGRYYEEALRQAVEHGATGLLLLAEHETQIDRLRTYREPPYLPKSLPTLWVGEAAAEALLAGSGYRPSDLTILYQSLRLETRAEVAVPMEEPGEAPARNVLGLLPGADPARTSEVLVLGAHYDHLGTDGNGDIYYGANDDASGVAALLEIARSWQAAGYRPDTSVLFAAWDAEEQGLLGATHYLSSPPIPLAQTLGMLQLDMVGLATDGVLTVGGEDTAVGRQAAASAALFAVLADGPSGAASGSDHQAFCRAGVPAALLSWDGFAVPHYHTPSDTPETLQPERLRQAGVVASHAALALSSAHGRVRDALERQAEAIRSGDPASHAAALDPADPAWQEAGREWLSARAADVAIGFALKVDAVTVHGDWAGAEVTARLTDTEGHVQVLAEYAARLVRRDGAWYGARPAPEPLETAHLAAHFVIPWRAPLIVRDELADPRPAPEIVGRPDAEWLADLDATYARVLAALGHAPAERLAITVYPTGLAHNWLAPGGWGGAAPAADVSRTAPLTETAVALALEGLGLPPGQGEWLRVGLVAWLAEGESLPEGPAAGALAVAGRPEDVDPVALLATPSADRAGARSLVAHLLAGHGVEGLAALCRAWGETGDLAGGLAALGTTPEAFAAGWQAAVGEPLRAARAGIAATLAGQQSALLAGDRAGYLATIDPGDPLFFAEQAAWFGRSAGQVEAWSPQVEVTALTPEEAVATLTVSVRAGGADSAQRLALAVRFTRSGDAWRLAGPAWQDAPGAPLPVRHAGLDEETAAALVAAVERAHRQVTEDLGLPLPRPLDVRVYPTDTLFHYTLGIGTSGTEGLPASGRGHYAPGEALRLSTRGNRADDAPLLARFLTRAVLVEAGLADPWLVEGLALFEAARAAPGDSWRLESAYFPAVREAVRLDRLPGWAAAPARLEDAPEAERVLRVGQAWQLWEGVAADHGLAGVRALARGLASGEALPEAFAAATGRALAEWEPGWRARILAGGVSAEALDVAQGFDPERALAVAVRLASPRYGGRQPGSPGAEAAAAWIAGEMAAIGLRPGGADGTYLSGDPLSYSVLLAPPRLALRHMGTGDELVLPYPEGFRDVLAGCAGAGEAHAGLVWVPEEYRTGWDLGGRVVLRPLAHTVAEEAAHARQVGAGGLILVSPRVDTRTREAPVPGGDEPTLPVALISEETWRGILSLAGLTTRQALDAPPALLLPIEADLVVSYAPVEERPVYDVVGVLPGNRADAAPLVVAAHYDGVGSLPGGPHYPGANDNAAGVGVLLEAAHRLAASGLAPERSIYVVALGAEEVDLASTRRLLAAPDAPLDGALGYLLLDGVGNARSYYLTFDGDPARDGRLLHDLALAAGLLDRRVRPGNHEATNSHDVLHEAGLPAVLLFWPDPSHRHRLEDTPDLLDPHKLATTGEVLTLALYTLSR